MLFSLLLVVIIIVAIGVIFHLLSHTHYELLIAGQRVRVTKNRITKKLRVKVNKDTYTVEAHQITTMKANRGTYKVKKEWENESA
ncbi:MAG TPA: hypothetical protein DEP42_07195 [Ruminococcaceae bacterium]|nr:hypothetical protein [Oscillospiraceae bacterium]